MNAAQMATVMTAEVRPMARGDGRVLNNILPLSLAAHSGADLGAEHLN
jgi:hypothetical protein